MSHVILAVTEFSDGEFRKVSFEALSEGRRLADALGGSLTALALGEGCAAAAGDLARYGADKIVTADHPGLARFLADSAAAVAAAVVTRETPAAVIIGATTQGKDLAARLAARLDAGLAMEVVATRVDDDRVVATRPIYGGKVTAEVTLTGAPAIVALRPNSVPVAEAPGAGVAEAFQGAVPPSRLAVVDTQTAAGRVELTEAEVVVSGGRGMGGSDYSVLKALADALGGAVGASRSAVDEGWRDPADQVGQTGKTVSPNLYVACGISGAIQHLAGMSTSKVIVAINKDPEAPIFAKADYGIVGDLFALVPLITAEVKKRRA